MSKKTKEKKRNSTSEKNKIINEILSKNMIDRYTNSNSNK